MEVTDIDSSPNSKSPDDLQDVIKRLETSIFGAGQSDEDVTDGTSSGDSLYGLPSESNNNVHYPLSVRVRDIVTRNLIGKEGIGTGMAATHDNIISLQEENRMLVGELQRLEQALSNTRAERDDIGIKYHTLSERLEQTLNVGGGSELVEPELDSSKILLGQNVELKLKLEEEHSGYRRKLQTYQDGQQRQAQLVHKLQSKVIQYRKKCQDLESSVLTKPATQLHSPSVERQSGSQMHLQLDMDSALARLEEEQQRSSSLAHVNSLLRQQLEQATGANQQLTNDVQKMTEQWEQARQEIEIKEVEWHEEERSFNDYFSQEHTRLLTLWRQMVDLRRKFSEMKSKTELDLASMCSEVKHSNRDVLSMCMQLNATSQSGKQSSLDDAGVMKLELELREKSRDLQDLQSKNEKDREALNRKLDVLTAENDRLKTQVQEKEKSIASLSKVTGRTQVTSDSDNTLREEVEDAHNTIQELAQAVLSEQPGPIYRGAGDMTDTGYYSDLSTPLARSTPYRLSLRSRSSSPKRHGKGKPLTSLVQTVQKALHKRSQQVRDLEKRLQTSESEIATTKKRSTFTEERLKELEQRIQQLNKQLEQSNKNLSDAMKEREAIRKSLDSTSTEKFSLESLRTSLNKRLEELNAENTMLQQRNLQLQKENEGQEIKIERCNKQIQSKEKEIEKLKRQLESMDGKNTTLKEEVSSVQEALHRAQLNLEIAEEEKSELRESLQRAEDLKSEAESQLNKMRENLARLEEEHAEVNHSIQLVQQETIVFKSKNQQLLDDQKSAINKLDQNEQERMRLETDKIGLSQHIKSCEENTQELENNIKTIGAERNDLAEQVRNITRQKNQVEEEFNQRNAEFSQKVDAFNKVCEEKEGLAKENAQLLVQVSTGEREKRQQESNVMTLRNEKDKLETNLYDAKQQAQTAEARCQQLELEILELIKKKQQLQDQLEHLEKEMENEQGRHEQAKHALELQLEKMEKEHQQKMKEEKLAHEDVVEGLIREKEGVVVQCHHEKEKLAEAHQAEKQELEDCARELKQQHNEGIKRLNVVHEEAVESLHQQHEQVVEQAEEERCRLLEEIDHLSSKLKKLQEEKENHQKEAEQHLAQYKVTIEQLQEELTGTKQQILLLQKEIKDAQNLSLSREKEIVILQDNINSQKMQLNLAEESNEALNRQLATAKQLLKDAEDEGEDLRKDLQENQHMYTEMQRERESAERDNETLMGRIKQVEAESSFAAKRSEELGRKLAAHNGNRQVQIQEATELRSSLKEVEGVRQEMRKQLLESKQQMKQVEDERDEFQFRCRQGEEREEEGRREMFSMHEKLAELEGSHDFLRKDLVNADKRCVQIEEELSMRTLEHQQTLQSVHQNADKMLELRRTAENNVATLQSELGNAKLALSACEGRIAAMETQLNKVEGSKRDVEYRLSSIYSTLRQSLGVRPGKTEVRSSRSFSPSRSRSRSRSPVRCSQSGADIDPETVRTSIRTFASQLSAAERQRDDLEHSNRQLQKHAEEQKLEHARLENKLQRMQQSLGQAQAQQKGVDGRLANSQTAILIQEETIKKQDRDRKLLNDSLAHLQSQIHDKDMIIKDLKVCKLCSLLYWSPP